MRVSNPWEGTEGTDSDGKVGDETHDQDGVVSNIEFHEVHHNFVEQPDDTRQSASTMNSSQMLENRCASETEPERGPLFSNGD